MMNRSNRIAWTLLLVTGTAGATVQQPDGKAIPRAPSPDERSLVTSSWGWNANTESYRDLSGNYLTEPIVYGDYYSPPAFPQFVDDDAITLAGLFKWRGEAIDWKADATSPAGAFVPTCPITMQLVLRGGGCEASLAWYNVTDPNSHEPPNRPSSTT